MKIGSKLQFEVPDRCPENCPYFGDLQKDMMLSDCFRCPVFSCQTTVGGINMISPESYHDESANLWEMFFKNLKDIKQ